MNGPLSAWAVVAVTCAAGAAIAGACAPPERGGARNAVLIVADTLRADHLGAYGYALPTSPRFDALALEATFYARAQASSAWTLPTHATLFTGLHPYEHGAVSYDVRSPNLNNAYALDEGHTTLAEALAREGYLTAAFVANETVLAPRMGLDQGFDTWVRFRAPGAVLNQEIFSWLDVAGKSERPFFLFVNYMDTHRPYNTRPRPGLEPPGRNKGLLGELLRQVLSGEQPVPDELRRRVVSQYDTAVANVDAAIGELLERLEVLGLYDETIVVVTSDHGEYFGEHRLVEHAKDVYQEVLWVPLLVKPAGPARGERVETPVSSVHVPHLIVAGLSRETADRLAPLFPRAPDAGAVIAENYFSLARDLGHRRWGDRFRRVRRAVLAWPHKYIHSSDGRHELYDLEADPGERHDLIGTRPGLAADLAEHLEGLPPEAPLRPGPRPQLDPTKREVEQLRELGYVE